jgi:ADP-heptose:LPS heptosyltransferase
MGRAFLSFLARVFLRQKTSRKPPPPLACLDREQVRKVLLINATALGDLLFSTPALRALRETYPHWTLDLLVSPRFADLVRHHPAIRHLWLYPGRGPGLFRLGRELRRQGYDLAIILHGNDPEATLLAHASGAPFIIGSARSPLSFVYSAAVPRSHPLEHAIEHRLNYVRLLGADTEDKHMEMFLPPEEEARAEALLARHFGASASRLLALHPTGSGAYKWWPLENFATLGTWLYQRYQAPLLIISGSRDRPVAEALAARLPGPTLVTGGRFSLLTVAALLKRARLLVANDSGPLHMALALGVPTIALIGADHPARIGPYQVDWGIYLYKKDEVCQEERCLNHKCPNNRCMQAIEVKEAVRTIKSWWEKRVWEFNKIP